MIRNLFLALFLAVGVAACGSAPKEQRSAGEFTDDAALTAKVKSAIATDAGAVEADRGAVQLTGFVDSDEQASRVVTATKKVSGVRSVKNDIRIKKGS